MNQQGSASLFGLVTAVMVVVATLLLVDIMMLVDARSRAMVAADAAALAAAPYTFEPGDPNGAAARFARLNQANLARCDCRRSSDLDVRRVEVEVWVTVNPTLLPFSRVFARAIAEYDPVAAMGG